MDENKVLENVRRRKVITLDQLVDLLGSSAITARRRLKQWRAHTSINQNGRYYTLPQVPVFDENGLWRYQTVIFSRHGNMKQTIMALIEGSPKGLAAAEIAELVDLAPNSSFLSQFKDVPGVKREKHGGRFVYLSDRPDIRERQKERWEEIAFPTDAQAVSILVWLIKHPGEGIEELAARVPDRNLSVAAVQRFLSFHGLLKKTLDTRP